MSASVTVQNILNETIQEFNVGPEGGVVALDGPSRLVFDFNREDILSVARDGSTLTITLQDGTQIVIENYEDDPASGPGSVIVLADGGELVATAAAMSSGLLLGGGLAAVAGLAAAGGGGDDGGAVDGTAPTAPTADDATNEDGTVTVSGEAEPGSTVTVTFPDGTTGEAVADENGDYSIPLDPALTNDEDLIVTATDASGNASGSVTATAPNTTAPTAVADANNVNEDSSITGSVAGNDTDLDGSETYSLTGAPIAGLELASDGSYTFDAADPAYQDIAADEEREVTATYTVTDGAGNNSSADLTITITGTNDAAVVTGAVSGAVTEDSGIAASGTLLATDVDNTDNTFQVNSGTATYGSWSVDAAGAWSYTLDDSNTTVDALNVGDAPLTDSFNVLTEDGTVQTVTVTITGTNDAPVINETTSVLSQTTRDTIAVTGLIEAADVDLDDTLTYSVLTGSEPMNGTVTFDAVTTNQYTYTPTAGVFGTDTFTVEVSDGKGGTDTVEVTVHVTDGIVEGTAGDDIIDSAYVGDDDFGSTGAADRIDNDDGNPNSSTGDDDLVQSYDGDDSILSGAGNDTVFGGYGNDTIDGGAGNDLIDERTPYIDKNTPFDGVVVNGEFDTTEGWTLTGDVLINFFDGANRLQFNSGIVATRGVGSQIISTTAGEAYSLSFNYGEAGGTVATHDLLVEVIDVDTNTVLGSYSSTAADGTFPNLSATLNYVATGAETELRFSNTGDSGDTNSSGLSVDNVVNTSLLIDDDVLLGGDGDDTIYGAGGNDSIDGGAGADSLFGGDGNDTILAGLGNDTVFGDAGDDSIDGGDGDDRIFGGSGADSIFGGAGADEIFGGDGNDYIDGGEGADSVLGNRGDDTLVAGQGDFLSGRDGNDLFLIDTAYGDNVGGVVNIEGGETRENNGGDTLDLTGLQIKNLTYVADTNNENGSFTYLNDAGGEVLVNFIEIENLIGQPASIDVTAEVASPGTIVSDDLVNTTTATNQSGPVTVATADGGYVTVWYDNAFTNSGANPTNARVRAQWYDENGVKQGTETLVGSSSVEEANGFEMPPLYVTALDNGNVVVSWNTQDSQNVAGTGSRSDVVQSLLSYNAATDTLTASSQQVVNTYTPSNQSGPVTVATSGGGHFTAWYDNANDNPAGRVRGQFFDQNGVKDGSEILMSSSIRVEGSSNGDMPPLDVIVLDNGNVVISWVSEHQDQAQTDGDGTAVVQTILGANGTVLTAAEVVNSTTAGSQSGPVSVATADGGYVTLWYDDAFGADAGRVRGQWFDANGDRVGGEISVGDWRVEGGNDQKLPPLDAVLLDNGDVAVGWQVRGGEVGFSARDVAISILSRNGTNTFASTQSELTGPNTTTAGGPVMVATSDGGFAAAWYDNSWDAFLQFVDANGNPIGAPRRISTGFDLELAGNGDMPVLDLAVLDNGNVVVSWVSNDAQRAEGLGSDSTAVLQTVYSAPPTQVSLSGVAEAPGNTMTLTDELGATVATTTADATTGEYAFPVGTLQQNTTYTLTDGGGTAKEIILGDGGNNALTPTSGNGGVILGLGGDDTFDLSGSGSYVLDYSLLEAADALGGNGTDSVDGFTVGDIFSNSNADQIDLSALLPDGVTGAAGGNLSDYVTVTNDGTNSTLSIDRDGTGTGFAAEALLQLNGVVVTDEQELWDNGQIVV